MRHSRHRVESHAATDGWLPDPGRMTPFLEVIGLRKQFSSQSAVGPVAFHVEEGEFLSLLGPSGCGKTTTLRGIAGFAQPTAGDIRIQGRSILPSPPHRRDIGLVFQNYAL